jgi:hypothetical protein
VTGNRVGLNGTGASNKAGIRSADSGGGGSQVDGNYAENNTGIGILAGDNDFVTRNTAKFNNDTGGPANYSPTSGLYIGPIESPGTATHPFANFSQTF